MDSGVVISFGVVLILAGFFAVLVGSLLSVGGQVPGVGGGSKVAVVGFIGPFPIGFGTDKSLLTLSVIIGFVIIAIFLILRMA